MLLTEKMPENTSFEERIRISFSKAKEHTNKLENELKELKNLLEKQNKEIIDLKSQITNILSFNTAKINYFSYFNYFCKTFAISTKNTIYYLLIWRKVMNNQFHI